MKKLSLIFLISFVFNLAWEHLHSLLYAGYKGGAITEFILFRASLADAVMITIVALPFLYVPALKARSWLIAAALTAVAISIELYALGTGRWAYNEYMPIIPLLGIGLTPAVQLGLLGYLSYRLAVRRNVAS